MLSEQPFPDSDATVQFQSPVPAPEAKTGLLVKNLGPKITEPQLYDLFVVFGPLNCCTVNVRAKSEVSATLQFFIKDHAQKALQEMVRIRENKLANMGIIPLMPYIAFYLAFDSTARILMAI